MADKTAYEPQELFTLGGEDVKKRNRDLTVARRDFTEQVEMAIATTDPRVPKWLKKEERYEDYRYRTKEEKLEALDEILMNPAVWENDPVMCMQVFSACRELGQTAAMIYVHDVAENSAFKNAPMVREQLAAAYAKEETRTDAGEDNKTKAVRICQNLKDNKQASSVSYAVLSQCQNPEEARKTLEEGFKETLDPFVGLQAVQANIRMGGEEDKKHAQELAKVVYLSALRDGAEETTDFYTLSAALQTAVIAGEKPATIDHFVARIAKCVEHPWEMDELKRNMAALESAGLNADMAKSIQGKLEQIEQGNKALGSAEKANNGEVKDAGNAQETGSLVLGGGDDRTFGDDKKLEALRNHSYNYRGCGSDFRGVSRVGGNMEFGGQLPSHTVSRKDLELFTGLVNASPEALGLTAKDLKGVEGIEKVNLREPLSAIDDPEVFMQVADKFIRKTFMTEAYVGETDKGSKLHLEDNALAKEDVDGKSIYDRAVVGVEETFGKVTKNGELPEEEQQREKDFTDTRTNIAAIFALGMGDCRHHAQVKQIMFDMYQRQQMNGMLSEMLQDVNDGKPVDIQNGAAAEKFYEVLDTELRSADVKVMLPVQMQQGIWDGKPYDKMYQPELTTDKKFTIDTDFDRDGYQDSPRGGNDPDHLHCLEEHTFCWLIKKNRQGELESFGLRDAFYQTEGKMYQWGHKDIGLSAIHTDGGKLEIDAGVVAGDKADTNEDFPIYLRPTNYNTGKRDKKVMSSTGEDICMVGMEVKGFDTTEDFIGMILAQKEKEEMLRVMQADGKAIVAGQDARAGTDAYAQKRAQDAREAEAAADDLRRSTMEDRQSSSEKKTKKKSKSLQSGISEHSTPAQQSGLQNGIAQHRTPEKNDKIMKFLEGKGKGGR